MKDCTRHWRMQRLTSLPLIPLFFYFLTQTEFLAAKDRTEFVNWVKQPWTAAALAIFIFCAFFHASLGMEEIIVDYVSAEGQKKAALLANKLFFFSLGAAAVYAVVTISCGNF